MASILVTGGAGFIGSHLVEALIARGDAVTVVDDLSTGRREHIPGGAEVVEVNVADRDALNGEVGDRRFDAVLHVAGKASISQSFARPADDLATNVVGTLNIIDLCIASATPRLVLASSMTVYGNPEQVPTSESQPCVPVSYYGVTKYAAERYALVAGERDDVSLAVTALRMFNVYGERQSLTNPYQGVLAIFIGNVMRGEPITIHSDGGQTRDFIHISDAVRAWLAVLDDKRTAGRVFNVGSGRETTIADLADAVLLAFRRSRVDYEVRFSPPQLGDQRRSWADTSAIRQATGWRPRTPLEDGMRRTVAWALGS